MSYAENSVLGNQSIDRPFKFCWSPCQHKILGKKANIFSMMDIKTLSATKLPPCTLYMKIMAENVINYLVYLDLKYQDTDLINQKWLIAI